MGQRGFAPRPAELARIEGERPQRINDAAPVPAAGWPEPPPDISNEALAIWVQLKADMAGTGHVRQVDRDVVRTYCDLIVRYRYLQNAYEQMGPVTEIRKPCKGCEGCEDGRSQDTCPGYWVEKYVTNPIANQLRDVTNQIKVFAREIGASPSARSGIKDPTLVPDNKGKADPAGDYF